MLGEAALFVSGLVLFGSALLTAYIGDFVVAYLLGIAFQFFAIAPRRHLGRRAGFVAAAKADTLSLIAFEVGMFAGMARTRLVFFHPAPPPDPPLFWFMMQIAGQGTTRGALDPAAS